MARGRKAVKLDWFGDDLQRAVDRAGEPALWAAGQALKREAVHRAPSKTGLLRRSAFVKTLKRTDYIRQRRARRKIPMPGSDSVVVGFGAWYGNLLEDSGAVAHKIPYKGKTGRARQRKILRIDGRYFTAVNHPGMQRKPFLSKALEAVKGRIVQEINNTLGREIDRELPDA